MRVLHLSYSDFEGAGGAGISVHRIHTGLRKAGIDSKILCRLKTLKSDDSRQIPRSILEFLLKKVTTPLGLNELEGVGSFAISRHELFKTADILHLHAIHSGFFNYFALPSLTKRKATVWTPPDIWPLTGHCTYNYDCARWKTGCGRCPYPDHYPPIQRDATAFEWRFKKWVYARSKIHFVVLSQYFYDMAKQSMLSHFPIHRIPRGVDTEAFKPLNRSHCRSVLGIPQDKRVLMFGAVNAKLSNKGGDLLLRALRALPGSLKKDLVILTIGYHGASTFEDLEIPAYHLGYIANDAIKAIAYSAADLYVHPTRYESFSNVSIESMGCGVPVVSFAVTAVPEVVRHGVTGYTAKPEDAEDLAHGIEELLRDEPALQAMRERCRQMVVNEYSEELQTQRYIELYKKILSN